MSEIRAPRGPINGLSPSRFPTESGNPPVNRACPQNGSVRDRSLQEGRPNFAIQSTAKVTDYKEVANRYAKLLQTRKGESRPRVVNSVPLNLDPQSSIVNIKAPRHVVSPANEVSTESEPSRGEQSNRGEQSDNPRQSSLPLQGVDKPASSVNSSLPEMERGQDGSLCAEQVTPVDEVEVALQRYMGSSSVDQESIPILGGQALEDIFAGQAIMKAVEDVLGWRYQENGANGKRWYDGNGHLISIPSLEKDQVDALRDICDSKERGRKEYTDEEKGKIEAIFGQARGKQTVRQAALVLNWKPQLGADSQQKSSPEMWKDDQGRVVALPSLSTEKVQELQEALQQAPVRGSQPRQEAQDQNGWQVRVRQILKGETQQDSTPEKIGDDPLKTPDGRNRRSSVSLVPEADEEPDNSNKTRSFVRYSDGPEHSSEEENPLHVSRFKRKRPLDSRIHPPPASRDPLKPSDPERDSPEPFLDVPLSPLREEERATGSLPDLMSEDSEGDEPPREEGEQEWIERTIGPYGNIHYFHRVGQGVQVPSLQGGFLQNLFFEGDKQGHDKYLRLLSILEENGGEGLQLLDEFLGDLDVIRSEGYENDLKDKIGAVLGAFRDLVETDEELMEFDPSESPDLSYLFDVVGRLGDLARDFHIRYFLPSIASPHNFVPVGPEGVSSALPSSPGYELPVPSELDSLSREDEDGESSKGRKRLKPAAVHRTLTPTKKTETYASRQKVRIRIRRAKTRRLEKNVPPTSPISRSSSPTWFEEVPLSKGDELVTSSPSPSRRSSLSDDGDDRSPLLSLGSGKRRYKEELSRRRLSFSSSPVSPIGPLPSSLPPSSLLPPSQEEQEKEEQRKMEQAFLAYDEEYAAYQALKPGVFLKDYPADERFKSKKTYMQESVGQRVEQNGSLSPTKSSNALSGFNAFVKRQRGIFWDTLLEDHHTVLSRIYGNDYIGLSGSFRRRSFLKKELPQILPINLPPTEMDADITTAEHLDEFVRSLEAWEKAIDTHKRNLSRYLGEDYPKGGSLPEKISYISEMVRQDRIKMGSKPAEPAEIEKAVGEWMEKLRPQNQPPSPSSSPLVVSPPSSVPSSVPPPAPRKSRRDPLEDFLPKLPGNQTANLGQIQAQIKAWKGVGISEGDDIQDWEKVYKVEGPGPDLSPEDRIKIPDWIQDWAEALGKETTDKDLRAWVEGWQNLGVQQAAMAGAWKRNTGITDPSQVQKWHKDFNSGSEAFITWQQVKPWVTSVSSSTLVERGRLTPENAKKLQQAGFKNYDDVLLFCAQNKEALHITDASIVSTEEGLGGRVDEICALMGRWAEVLIPQQDERIAEKMARLSQQIEEWRDLLKDQFSLEGVKGIIEEYLEQRPTSNTAKDISALPAQIRDAQGAQGDDQGDEGPSDDPPSEEYEE